MAKGLFSQSVCLLTDGQATLLEVTSALQRHSFEIVKEIRPLKQWQFGGPAVVVGYRPEVNGCAILDLVNRPWPDTMVHPESDTTTFGAWSMGHFGPWTFPNGLQRARQHAWSWAAGRSIADAHSGFIRIRLRYAVGAAEGAPLLPANYDPVDELNFLSRLVLAAGEAAGVLCYFNPNGEVLRDHAGFSRVWRDCAADELIPLPLWTNVRLFQLTDQLALMDTVGNSQLDRMDIEAIFASDEYEPSNVDNYLRNVSLYLLHSNPEFETGQTMDGPGATGSSWAIDVLDAGLVNPPRKVLRLYPKRHAAAVADAVASAGARC